ncbi:carbohydrate kinase [Halorubrum sp. 48-1-W]|uniref:carbohydrate kinase family protein n=1 Tax=Halorubrum sp. 48-1-W TaxID=2249761 RepID=UPI000DCE0F8A|nr:carbohydrate kinase [Halorubrum sp. 48-1-W]RAW46939.1 carbohydrate kinase [Halorubrum sp. 48-1-W]
MTRILVTGETLIDFVPEDHGPLDAMETFHRRAGGAPANVAVGLARLGEPPSFWTRIGDDPFGDYLARTLAEAGVREDLIERDPDADTALVFVSLDPDADRAFSFHRNGTADTRMQPGTVGDGTLAETEWVHAGGVVLADEPSRTATFDLLSRANDVDDAVVSFDPNARPELFEGVDFVDSCRRAFELADVVKATAEDLVAAGIADPTADDGDAPALASAVCDRGPHTVLLTRGADGALARATPEAPWNPTDEPLVVEHGGCPVDPVDTTGAGDAFTAGAITALSAGESLSEAVAFANAVAARSTTAKGAMTALPTRPEVEELRAETD